MGDLSRRGAFRRILGFAVAAPVVAAGVVGTATTGTSALLNFAPPPQSMLNGIASRMVAARKFAGDCRAEVEEDYLFFADEQWPESMRDS